MSKIKGQNFRVLQAGSAIPESTNCSVTFQGNTEDVTTKDTEGSYSQESVTTTTWSVSVDSYQAETAQLIAIGTTFNSDSNVTVGWDQTATTSGSQNRTPASASFARSGSAILNDVTMQFTDRETVTVSVQFQGTGALS